MSDKPVKTLLVEDNPGDARLISEMLVEERNAMFKLKCVAQLSDALEYLAAEDVDLILLDLSLPDSQGFDTFTEVYSQASNVPIIILTSFDDESLAIKAVREGAQDYLTKGQLNSHLLVRAMRYAIERKEIDRLKSELISIASHELRSPLTAILGSLNLVVNGDTGELPEEAKTMIDIAYRNSKRLLRLINDMLDIKKIESGKMEFRYQLLELNSIAQQAVEANRSYAEPLAVELVLEESSPEVEVYADSERLMQVFTNLLSNAVRFSPPGGEVLVSVSHHNNTEEMAGLARISITDHGTGIPEEFRERVFQKFAQAHTPGARGKGGSGLGLSIAKAIVEGMDGQIGFQTETNVGTTFYFDLPECNTPSMHFAGKPS